MNDCGFIVAKSHSCQGEGLISTGEFVENDVVFSETPFLFLQSLPNRQHALVCSCCSRFLGSVGLQMKFLQKEITRQNLMEGIPTGFKEYKFLSDIIPCVLQCGELYCSEECKARHWSEKGHCMLCTGQIDESQMDESPLYQCKMFIVQSNEIFLLICDILAQWITRFEQLSESERQATIQNYSSRINLLEEMSSIGSFLDPVQIFQEYVRNIWWEAIDLPKHPNKRKQLQKTLQTLVSDLWDHLDALFQLEEKGYHHIFSKEWIAR